MSNKYHLDYETRSRADLRKVGAARYAADPSTRILMFAIRKNTGKTLLWLNPVFGVPCKTNAEALLLLKEACNDPEALIYAHNAPFEMFISHYRLLLDVGIPMFPVEKLRCTMAMARKAGLRVSLENVGEDLGMRQLKFNYGRSLIYKFSVPQKKTGEFIEPKAEPEKFIEFGEYCVRDVDAESEAHGRMAMFELKGMALETFLFDLRMNLRGFPVNVAALKHAQSIIEKIQTEVSTEFKQLTGLEPTQREKVKAYLSLVCEADLANLQGKTIDKFLKALDAAEEEDEEYDETDLDVPVSNEKTRRILELYKQVRFAAVKKVKTMLDCVCPDGYIRGMFTWHGAGTGRWCLTGDHEVLTRDGWKRLDEWEGGDIACWSKDETISFQHSKAKVFPFNGTLYRHEGARIDQIATDDHRMAGWDDRSGEFQVKRVRSLGAHFCIPCTGNCTSPNSIPDDQLRLLVAVQADGHFAVGGEVKFHLKKQRKIERLRELLHRCELPFHTQHNGDGSKTVIIRSRHVPLYLQLFKSKTFGPWLLNADAGVFFEELELWDGSRAGPNSIQYSTTNKTNADWVQAFAHTSGLTASVLVKSRRGRSDTYAVNVWLSPTNRYRMRSAKVSEVRHRGNVYCAATPTGFFLVRRNGLVWVTGNTAQKVQPQNFRTPKVVSDPSGIYEMICAGCTASQIEFVYGNPLEAVADCIRNFIQPHEGRMFDADYSGIEARIVAWLTNEEWRLEVFRTHGKIYEASASQMFKIALADVTKPIRQKGKIAELALQYQGAAGAMKKMGALDMGLKETELPEIVKAWRSANPNIVSAWYELEECAIAALKAPNIAIPALDGRVRFKYTKVAGLPYLLLTLPSGRNIAYPHPRLEEIPFQGDYSNMKLSFTYYGQIKGKKWGRVAMYGGKWLENIAQGTAFDFMGHGAVNAEKQGFPAWALIHDQELAPAVPGRTVEEFAAALTLLPSWADGMPLKAEGEDAPFYTKAG